MQRLGRRRFDPAHVNIFFSQKITDRICTAYNKRTSKINICGVSRPMLLFGGTDMYTAKTTYLQRLVAEIQQIPRDQVLHLDVEATVASLVQKYRLDIPVVHLDRKEIIEEGEQAGLTYFVIEIPFEGSPQLLTIRPTTSLMRAVDGDVRNGALCIRYSAARSNRAALKPQMEQDLQALEVNLANAAKDVQGFDDELATRARLTLQQRRDELIRDQKFVEDLGIPIRRRTDVAPTYPIPMTRKQPPTPPPVPKQPPTRAPDPTITTGAYEDILRTISNMVLVMERSPGAFSRMEEEHLRDIILVLLNAQFEGQATGETFNGEGKTDILVRANGGNLFIAECKIWSGRKAYLEAIDQLLRYVTWRDTKTALIIFNRQKNLTNILTQIPSATAEHPNFKRQLDYKAESAFRFVMANSKDKEREFLMTVMVFDVPV